MRPQLRGVLTCGKIEGALRGSPAGAGVAAVIAELRTAMLPGGRHESLEMLDLNQLGCGVAVVKAKAAAHSN